MARENIFTLSIPEIGYEGSVSITIRVRKCRIAFDVDNTDYKNGIFGFCEYSNSLKNKLKDSTKATALQAEFPPTGLQIEGNPYYSSWVSMRKGQTITLKLDWEDKSLLQDYANIAFDANPNFTFSATDLRDPADPTKGAKEIKITCNATSQTPTRLEIKADNNVIVGVLNVFHPPPKKARVRWFVVENNAGSRNTDKNEITGQNNHNINLASLQSDFKKAFNPALIDIDFLNSLPIILDITTLPTGLQKHIQQRLTTNQQTQQQLKTKIEKYQQDTFRPLEEALALDQLNSWTPEERAEIQRRVTAFQNDPTYIADTYSYKQLNTRISNEQRALQMAQNKTAIFTPNTTDQINRDSDRKAFIELLKSVYALQHNATLENDTIYLFLTYLKCETPNSSTGKPDEVQGFTYSEQNSCIMFTKNSQAKATFYKDMPHEVMHALDLEHTFESVAQHTFDDTKTDNYMDYNNTAKHTFVWQWRLLHACKLTV